MVTERRGAFIRSLSSELDAQADRVRHLIGGVHWTSDGSHKEALLAELLRRHVPSSLMVARGFVLNETNSSTCSTEQDILLIDTQTQAPLFKSGDLAITMPSHVVGSVSVKSSFEYDVMDVAIDGLASIGRTLPPTHGRHLWLGVYFFDTRGKSGVNLKTALKHVVEHSTIKRLSTFATELVVRADPSTLIRAWHDADGRTCAQAFRLELLSTGVFLARLLSHLARGRGGDASIETLLVELDSDIQESEQATSA